MYPTPAPTVPPSTSEPFSTPTTPTPTVPTPALRGQHGRIFRDMKRTGQAGGGAGGDVPHWLWGNMAQPSDPPVVG